MYFKKENIKVYIKKYGLSAIIFIFIVWLSSFLDILFGPINIFLINKLSNIKGPLYYIYNLATSFLNVQISLYSIIIATLILWGIYKIFLLYETSRRKLRIIKAEYGINNKYLDITEKLNQLIEDNKLKVVLSNALAGDPSVGVVKEGRIIYKYNGETNNTMYKEKDVVELP